MAKPPRSDLQEIARTLGVLFQPGAVVELRIPKTEHEGTVSGYFDNHTELAKQLAARNGDAAVTMANFPGPEQPEALAVPANDGFRLDDDQGRSPIAPSFAQRSP